MRSFHPAFTMTLSLALSCAAEERSDPASPREAASLWGRYLQLACDKARTCCDQHGFPMTQLEDCEQGLSEALGIDTLVGFVEDESVVMDRTLFTRCLDEAEKQRDACTIPSPNAACMNAVRGRLADGEACASPGQCDMGSGGAVCLRVVADDEEVNDTTPGVCHSRLRGERDDACVFTCEKAPCGVGLTTRVQPEGTALCFWTDGLYCDRERRCAPLVPLGEECPGSEACGRDAFCNDDGICQRAVGVGARCQLNAECTGHLTCSESDGTCAEPNPFREELCAGDFD